jgi:hypothetical protein
MALRWRDVILKQAEKVMIKGGRLEFIVMLTGRNKRKPVIHTYPENEIVCDEEELLT